MTSAKTSPFPGGKPVSDPLQEVFMLRPKLRLTGETELHGPNICKWSCLPKQSRTRCHLVWEARPWHWAADWRLGGWIVRWRLARDCNVSSWEVSCMLERIWLWCLARQWATEEQDLPLMWFWVASIQHTASSQVLHGTQSLSPKRLSLEGCKEQEPNDF